MIPEIVTPDIRHIASELSKDQCVLFVGSGLSTACGLSGWSDIIADLAKSLPCSSSSHDFLTIAQAYAEARGRGPLLECIASHVSTEGKKPSRVHSLLPSLGTNIWITTNFDDLLETTLRDAGHPFVTGVTDEHVPRMNTKAHVVVKLHGDLRDSSAVVFSKNDYFMAAEVRRLLWKWLEIQLAQRTFLFLGYSNSDPDFSQLQASLCEYLRPYGYRKSYAVMFGADDIKRLDLASRNITVLDLGALAGSAATVALCEFLEEVINNVRTESFVRPAIEEHKGKEAEAIAPENIQKELKADGFALARCTEYRIYSELVEGGQPLPIDSRWKLTPPPEYGKEGFKCVAYDRWDSTRKNRWVGWAVGQALQ